MRPGEDAPVFGNQQVVAMLEGWLEEAKRGKLNYVAIVATQLPNQMAADFAGISGMEPVVHRALDLLKNKIADAAASRALPPLDRELGADHVSYPLRTAACGWDFLIWLIDAEMTRRREGAPSPLRVAFVGETGPEPPYRAEMFAGVMRPLLPLIGAIEDQSARGGRHKPVYVLRDITAAVHNGEQVPLLRASSAAMQTVAVWLRGVSPITVTLREAKHWPNRNSNLGAWLKFADDLVAQGERVIIVRDTAKADEPLLGYETCPEASYNVDVRMALYEQAKCNCFVANGPFGLQLFGSRPYILFQAISADDPHYANHPGFWRDGNGIEDGEQMPWARADQRFIWQQDTYENIAAAWQEFRPMLLANAA